MTDHEIRLRLEAREESLASRAARASRSRGRQRAEEPSPMRTAFQRDRDRIIHCKAFRRLKHKTQVFIVPQGDHYVTRLTHTLEVSQVARSIARALNLNEDLAEAIALGHDLGHTPFGHAGEEALAQLLPGGFRHNEQSLRVVDILENDGRGLNLTWEVREGILKHSKSWDGLLGEDWTAPSTQEGQVCKIADFVAYINHDTVDAIRAGIIAEADLPPLAVARLGSTSSQRINTLVCDIVEHSLAAVEEDGAPIAMGKDVLEAANLLRNFLFERVYDAGGEEATRAREVVRFLFEHFVHHPEELPPEYRLRGENVERAAADYIAGMTDNFAMRLAQELSG